MSTHRVEELTHVNNEQSGTKESTLEDVRLESGYKVSAHWVKESTHKDSEQRFKSGIISVNTAD